MAKILVVEDEGELRELIVEHLESVGHVVTQASNGRDGLEIFARDTPDLVLSDITMPVMDGYQFLSATRKLYPDRPAVPFIFVSALSDRDNELKGLRLGVDDYIGKPVDFDVLAVRAEKSLRHVVMLGGQKDQANVPSSPDGNQVIEGLGPDGLVTDFASSFSSIIDQYLPRK